MGCFGKLWRKAKSKASKLDLPTRDVPIMNQAPSFQKAPSRPPTLDDIPELIEIMLNSKEGESDDAVKCILKLCDVQQNRVPMVCSGKYDVLKPLVKCLTQESGYGRRLACLALIELSVPNENKRFIALGPAFKDVIGGLCMVIAGETEISYLGCICLLNLSVFQASITTILQYAPSPSGKEKAPLDNPASLIRVLEKLLSKSTAAPKTTSGKSESVHWACGLLKNLSKSEENAAMIGKTDIPKCVIENIRESAAPPSSWNIHGLEDFSLFVILNLAQWPVSREVLVKAGAVDVVKPIMAEQNFQGLKATMTCAFLDAPWSSFPNGGKSAAKSVSELMIDIVERKGKDELVPLCTATKAFADLAKSAAKADEAEGFSNSMALAVPSTVALIFQIISDFVISAMDDAEGGSKYVGDAMSAGYAVTAIEAMLPAILRAHETPHKSTQTEKACGEISQMLLKYAGLTNSSPQASTSALAAAEKIKESACVARPILELSHNLWTQYREREGQALDPFMTPYRKRKGRVLDQFIFDPFDVISNRFEHYFINCGCSQDSSKDFSRFAETFLQDKNQDCLEQVLSFLTCKELAASATTCKALQYITFDSSHEDCDVNKIWEGAEMELVKPYGKIPLNYFHETRRFGENARENCRLFLLGSTAAKEYEESAEMDETEEDRMMVHDFLKNLMSVRGFSESVDDNDDDSDDDDHEDEESEIDFDIPGIVEHVGGKATPALINFFCKIFNELKPGKLYDRKVFVRITRASTREVICQGFCEQRQKLGCRECLECSGKTHGLEIFLDFASLARSEEIESFLDPSVDSDEVSTLGLQVTAVVVDKEDYSCQCLFQQDRSKDVKLYSASDNSRFGDRFSKYGFDLQPTWGADTVQLGPSPMRHQYFLDFSLSLHSAGPSLDVLPFLEVNVERNMRNVLIEVLRRITIELLEDELFD